MGKNDRSMLPPISPRASRRVLDVLAWKDGSLHISRADGRTESSPENIAPAPGNLADEIRRLFQ